MFLPCDSIMQSLGFGSRAAGRKIKASSQLLPTRSSNEAEDLDRNELLENVEPQDLMGYGLIPEFVGRFPVLMSLSSLQRQDLVKVLTEPRNSLISQYIQLMKMDKVSFSCAGVHNRTCVWPDCLACVLMVCVRCESFCYFCLVHI